MKNILISLALVFVLIFSSTGCGKKTRREKDYTQMYKQDLDEIFGDWEVVEKREESYSSYLSVDRTYYYVWEIAFYDSNENRFIYELSNFFDYSFEEIVCETSYYTLTHEIARLAGDVYAPWGDHDYSFTKYFSKIIYIGNYEVDNDQLDFTSPEFFPRNVSLSVLKNNDTYFEHPGQGKIDEMAEIFNNAHPNSLNFLLEFYDSETKRESGVAYIKGEKQSENFGSIRFRELFE